ncbi:hypothetical protein V8E36_008250 [Tilletia maclaganii]
MAAPLSTVPLRTQQRQQQQQQQLLMQNARSQSQPRGSLIMTTTTTARATTPPRQMARNRSPPPPPSSVLRLANFDSSSRERRSRQGGGGLLSQRQALNRTASGYEPTPSRLSGTTLPSLLGEGERGLISRSTSLSSSSTSSEMNDARAAPKTGRPPSPSILFLSPAQLGAILRDPSSSSSRTSDRNATSYLSKMAAVAASAGAGAGAGRVGGSARGSGSSNRLVLGSGSGRVGEEHDKAAARGRKRTRDALEAVELNAIGDSGSGGSPSGSGSKPPTFPRLGSAFRQAYEAGKAKSAPPLKGKAKASSPHRAQPPPRTKFLSPALFDSVSPQDDWHTKRDLLTRRPAKRSPLSGGVSPPEGWSFGEWWAAGRPEYPRWSSEEGSGSGSGGKAKGKGREPEKGEASPFMLPNSRELPPSSFYAQNKREESSPSPPSRRIVSERWDLLLRAGSQAELEVEMTDELEEDDDDDDGEEVEVDDAEVAGEDDEDMVDELEEEDKDEDEVDDGDVQKRRRRFRLYSEREDNADAPGPAPPKLRRLSAMRPSFGEGPRTPLKQIRAGRKRRY